MLVKKSGRKIPRNAVESLIDTSEFLSKDWEKPAAEIFKHFLDLMNRYADYFFSKPWPQKYDYDEATTFTDEDLEFLIENVDEFEDRYLTVCLKKNMDLECGFQGAFGMLWTQQAFHERCDRPTYKPVWEAFEIFAQGAEDARSVLNKLKEQFDANLVHDSLVDLFEADCPYGYPYEPERRRLIDEMLELLHTVEGVPSCKNWHCSWYMNQKYELHQRQIRASNKTLHEVENENKFGADPFLRMASLRIHRGEFELC